MINLNSAFFTNYILYFKNRFPIIPLFIFCFLYSVAIQKTFLGYISNSAILPTLFLFLSFLYLRLVDEIKDYQFDLEYHKQRPVQKGIVSLKDIKILLYLTIFCLLYLFYLMNILFLIPLFFLYTYVMYKDFFIVDFFHKASVIYLILHELLFGIIIFLFFSFYSKKFYLEYLNKDTILTIIFIISITIIEIGRKMVHRYSLNGKITSDTYAYEWGEKKSLVVFFILCSLNIFLIAIIKNTNYIVLSLLFLLICPFIFIPKFKNKIIKNHMLIMLSISLAIPIILII